MCLAKARDRKLWGNGKFAFAAKCQLFSLFVWGETARLYENLGSVSAILMPREKEGGGGGAYQKQRKGPRASDLLHPNIKVRAQTVGF